ncbi:PucR family transcriptional regulator [Enterococcus rivorum]|uniref:Transcriptional regulator n=1 Tax=Enterococcus rivorum TaxID=762845 RepID=A0A1E5KYU8_9ENTE|nr:PucR family transcriptional regulator [Enterococcus rivorum]MBP2097608.1 DNA-binding PucR family transcriptional regulator [Enterococcus rivorum]OEH83056.1 transcriptional regulator [Enterococcus rivorum]
MGVKVKDLLQLPSLREAQVYAGAENLERSVTSLSFLEVSDMLFFSKNIQMNQKEYYAGELLISSFYSIKDDVDKQCQAIQCLYDLGEIGIILYYVGIVLPKLSPKVVQLAEKLGFMIICMPKNDPSLRYNEVIYEVMNAIITKQSANDSFVNEILEKVSLLPEHLRSVEMTIKMLADRVKTNIILTTSRFEIINQVMWPRNSTLGVQQIIESLQIDKKGKDNNFLIEDLSVYQKEIQQKDNGRMYLFVITEKKELPIFELDQVTEVIQVALNLWGKKHGEVSEYALVKAIINDESEKMYRLAKILSVNVSSVQLLWLVHINDLSKEKEIRAELIDQLSKFYRTCVVQMIDHCFVVLLGNYMHKHSELDITKEFMETTTHYSSIKDIIFCPRMRNTSDVREMYQLVNDVEKLFPVIYKERKIFSAAEIKSLKKAMMLATMGEQKIAEHLVILEPLMEDKEAIKTLCSFLLDSNGSFSKCSELLYVHKNTVKYRIKKISELLGYDVTCFSETYDVYMATMIYRVLNH